MWLIQKLYFHAKNRNDERGRVKWNDVHVRRNKWNLQRINRNHGGTRSFYMRTVASVENLKQKDSGFSIYITTTNHGSAHIATLCGTYSERAERSNEEFDGDLL